MIQVTTKHILIPAGIFILFAGLYLLIAAYLPPERKVYCPNPDCHDTDVAIIEAPAGARPLPDSTWHYFRCTACGAVSMADFTVENLLVRPVWDIKHYQSIAAKGYEAFPCEPGKQWPVGDICGNVGWFPAWPIAVKTLSLNHIAGGLIVLPFVFALFGIILFYIVVIRLAGEKVAIIALTALVATPSAFYLLTGFPYAFILFLFSAYLFFLYDEKSRARKFLLPPIAFLISLSYPTGFLTAIIPAVMLFNQYRRRVLTPGMAQMAKEAAFYLVPFALGPLAVFLYFYAAFDNFWLFTQFQAKYHRAWDIPFVVMWKSMMQAPAWEPGLYLPPRLPFEQIALVYYGLIFMVFPPYRIKPELTAYALLFYLFSPMTGNIVSVYRHYIILFPLAMIIAASPRPNWLKALFIAAGLILALWRYYPFFLNGYLV